MEAKAYEAILRARLERHFDILPAEGFAAAPIDWLAVHNRQSEKFFFARKINLYRIENDEYVLFKGIAGRLEPELLRGWLETLASEIPKLARVGPDHMSSVVSFVLASVQPFPAETVKLLQKAKYHKDFLFTLRGWADLAVIGVDLGAEKIYSNAFGRKIVSNYELWKQ